MTDPRIAALAEALHAVNVLPFAEEQGEELREVAAAILAALPPDWCGHEDPPHDCAASIATSRFLRGENDRLHDDIQRMGERINEVVIDNARLRRIEEAARDADLRWWDADSGSGAVSDAMRALRAALEEKT